MRLEFDITLTAKDMFRFNLYQTYTGASGWISVIAAVVCFAAAGTKYSERGASYTVLGILLGALILFYMPVVNLVAAVTRFPEDFIFVRNSALRRQRY